MLLPSDRHTQADLDYWRDMEEADQIHGQRLQPKADAAIKIMREFARQPCYVATSWGKDSVVLSHLLVLSGLQLPLVNIWQEGPKHDPDVARVRDAFLSRFQCDYRELHVSRQEREQRDTTHDPALDIGIKRAAELLGTRRYIGGTRAAESGARTLRARRGIVVGCGCAPLSWWSDADVFGWLATYDLPVHPAYAMMGGGRWDRARIRVSIIGGAKGTQFGRREWEREYYGDVLRRLEAIEQPPAAAPARGERSSGE